MYKRIVVAVDGSEISERAIEAALPLCREMGAVMQPLYVINQSPIEYEIPAYDPTILRNAIREEGRSVTVRAVEKMRQFGVLGSARIVDATGFEDVAQVIVASAVEFDADLLIMGTHGRRGFRRLMLGSVAEHALRLSRIPILLVPAKIPIPDIGRSQVMEGRAGSVRG